MGGHTDSPFPTCYIMEPEIVVVWDKLYTVDMRASKQYCKSDLGIRAWSKGKTSYLYNAK